MNSDEKAVKYDEENAANVTEGLGLVQLALTGAAGIDATNNG
jgi:hypothetical protein